MEDIKIIDLFFERSEQAITELSTKYGKLAQGICKTILKNPSDAEECVNDSLFTTWNSIPPQRPNSLMAYFVSIARNKALDRYKHNSSVKRNSYYDAAIDELEDVLRTDNDPHKECEAQELANAINSFLGTINKEDRMIFVYRYYLSNPPAVIARKLKMKDSVVSTRLYRTCKKLRDYLRKESLI